MKAKNFLFVTFFLASAGLGLALPQSSTAFFPRADAELTGASKVVLDAANANAEDPGKGISPDCSAAIVKVVATPEFGKCVPLAALAPITPIVTDPSVLKEFLKDPAKNYEKLVEKPLVELATGICAAPKCSDKGNAAAIQALADGCKADLQTNDFVKLLFTVAVFYSPLRDIGCFKDKDQFCFDQTALTLIKLPPSPLKLTGDPFLDSIAVSDPLAICTKCNHDIVNTIFNFIKAKQDAKDPFVFAILSQAGFDEKKIDGAKVGSIVKCGLQFLDGKTP